MKNYFKTERGNTGIGERVKEYGGADGWESVADWALNRYDLRIRTRLRAMGLEIDSDGPLTVESIREAVNSKTGLDIEDLTPDGISKALDVKLAAELSSALGFEVSTVFNVDALKSEVKAQVLELVANGGGAGIVGSDLLESVRRAATYSREGLAGAERQKAENRYRQKKYRRSNKLVWT